MCRGCVGRCMFVGGVKEIVVRASFFTATIYHDHAAVTCTKHKLSSASHKRSIAIIVFPISPSSHAVPHQ